MKKIIGSALLVLSVGFSGISSAETVVTEVGVPIVVHGDTYEVVSTPDYYYYDGYRCYVKERVNVSGRTITATSGSKIYCYGYP